MGFLPVFFPPEGRLGQAPVHAQPAPVDALEEVILQQASLPELQEDAGLHPQLKAVVGGGTGTEDGGVQRLPRAAGAQDVEDGVQAHPVGHRRPTAAEAMRIHSLGEQRLQLLP